jgi:hypothetical protein
MGYRFFLRRVRRGAPPPLLRIHPPIEVAGIVVNDVAEAELVEETTPEMGRHSAARQRIAQTELPPVVEPKTDPIGHKSPDEALREQTQFAIISRALFQNATNDEIVESLREAGFMIAVRSLQRIMARGEFQEYYAQYRAVVLGPIDEQIRSNMKLAKPEAYNHLIKMMRSARSEMVKLDAIKTVLGDSAQPTRTSKHLHINVPPELQGSLIDAGARATAERVEPLTLPENASPDS